MRLFHSTHKQLSILEPNFGKNRHNGEDARAVGKEVVYLSSDEKEIFKEDGIVAQYKYMVEIDENDPDLYLDEKDFELRQQFIKEFNEKDDGMRWYFFLKPVKVLETFKWNGNEYVKINNFK